MMQLLPVTCSLHAVHISDCLVPLRTDQRSDVVFNLHILNMGECFGDGLLSSKGAQGVFVALGNENVYKGVCESYNPTHRARVGAKRMVK